MIEQPLKRLIDLPGIAEHERAITLPNAAWAPENDDLRERIDRLALQHFGVTEEQTLFPHTDRFWDHYDCTDPYDDNEGAQVSADRQHVYDQLNASGDWELHFALLDQPFEAQVPVWRAMGWDVSDGAGKALSCLRDFGRPLIVFIKNLPIIGKIDDPATPSAEAWGSSLEAEAKRFRASR